MLQLHRSASASQQSAITSSVEAAAGDRVDAHQGPDTEDQRTGTASATNADIAPTSHAAWAMFPAATTAIGANAKTATAWARTTVANVCGAAAPEQKPGRDDG